MDSSKYEAARAEIEDLLKLSFKETGTEYKIQKDEFNYIWVVLKDRTSTTLLRISRWRARS